MREKLKTVKSKTLLFLSMMVGIVLFQVLFGTANVIVGVGVITEALVLLGTDLTIQPLKSATKILILNLTLGLCASLVHINPWLGLVINLILVFISVYLLMDNLKTPVYFPFLLTYIFMMATAPVNISELLPRFGALIAGTGIIIALQFIFNRHKSAKISDHTFDSIAANIVTQIENTLNHTTDEEFTKKIAVQVRTMSKAMNDRRKHSFFVTNTALGKLNIVFCLERISLIVDEIDDMEHRDPLYDEALSDVKHILEIFQACVPKERLDHPEFRASIEQWIEKYQAADADHVEIYELTQLLSIFKKYTRRLQKIRNVGLSGTLAEGEIPKEYSLWQKLKDNFTPQSIRFSFALRLSLAIALTTLVTDIFHLEFGRWMVFTAFTLIQPYEADTKVKFRKRLFGTIVGLALLTILFTIFKDPLPRTVIMMLAGYISSYLTDYDKQMICITISALGAAAMSDTSLEAVEIGRLFYIIMGSLAAVLLNRLILRFTVEDSCLKLQQAYLKITKKLFELSRTEDSSDMTKNIMVHLILTCNLIEEKLAFNNTKLQNPAIEQFLENQRVLLNDIVFIAFWHANWTAEDPQIAAIMKDLSDYMALSPTTASDTEKLTYQRIAEQLTLLLQKADEARSRHQMVFLIALEDLLNEIQESFHDKNF